MKSIGIALLLGVATTGVVYVFMQQDAQMSEQTPTAVAPEGVPVFSWSYTPYEEEGMPHTEVGLRATYENDVTVEKVIDRVVGDCNVYEDPDEDVYEGSTMVICYYAGLGHYFKVVAEGDAYLVQRRVFKEGSPEYTPPVEPFVTITQF